jgi:tripeptidyl-peptidase-1
VSSFLCLVSTMLASLLNRGALSLAVVSLLASTAAAEVFDKLVAVPEGS